MNRTNICKNIVQSIKDYITDQVKLEPHRVKKHFVPLTCHIPVIPGLIAILVL